MLRPALLALLLAGCTAAPPSPTSPPTPVPAASPTYAGSQACARCHETEFQHWDNSHHHLALQPATPKTVLGDFKNAKFTYDGRVTRFFRKGDEYWVETDGPDGKTARYPVQYTFGVFPLQQYLLPLDGGRLQALSIAWDCQKKRWFHLYPGEHVDHQDPLHWTGPFQNWNTMCADCHSTAVVRGYHDGAFHTTWQVQDVSCEACHGPSSEHVAQRASVPHPLKRTGTWKPGHPPSGANLASPELETCAPCHSRRAQLGERHGPGFLDDYRPALLSEPEYEANGQNREEVYEYGAFLQSKMHARGVTCSDCHDPHSLALKAPGDALCLRCHTVEADHSHHREITCVECHMPQRTYMGVDVRHDHSFRVPRPDQGKPNTCTDCHGDRSAEWAAQAIRKWYGPQRKGFQTAAPVLQAARAGDPAAVPGLTQLAQDEASPAVVRATALVELSRFLSQESLETLRRGLEDREPLVRQGALQALEQVPPELRWQVAAKVLRDPVRSLRVEAARLLGTAPNLTGEQQEQLQGPLEEWRTVMRENAAEPETHLMLGLFHAERRDYAEARQEYEQAIRLAPALPRAYVNLADLYRLQNRDAEGEEILRRGLQHVPSAAGLHQALGLLLVRTGRKPAALKELRESHRLEPDDAHYSLVLALALEDAGKRAEALKVAQDGLRRHPHDAELKEVMERL